MDVEVEGDMCKEGQTQEAFERGGGIYIRDKQRHPDRDLLLLQGCG
jgi:hypothetical protein